MMIAQIKTMIQSERLQAMEEVWDVICHDESPLELPTWHEDILAERRKKIQSSTAEFVTLEELKTASR